MTIDIFRVQRGEPGFYYIAVPCGATIPSYVQERLGLFDFHCQVDQSSEGETRAIANDVMDYIHYFRYATVCFMPDGRVVRQM